MKTTSPLASSIAALLITLTGAGTALAQYGFTPLSSSVAGGSLSESVPFALSSGLFQTRIAFQDSVNYGGTGDNWDMNAFNLSATDSAGNSGALGKFLFVAHEHTGGGVTRINLNTGIQIDIARDAGYVSVDPVEWTSWGTVLFGEESYSSGKGRMFEITNPLASSSFNVVERTSVVGKTAHEGMKFDNQGAFYYVDEENNGAIYKFVSDAPNTVNAFASGTVYALKNNANSGNTIGTNNNRVGASTWVEVPDANLGDPRAYADTQFATNWQRPEDFEIRTLANGNQALVLTSTTDHMVFTIELTGALTADVRLFVDRNTIDFGDGSAVGTDLTSPDNLAIDASGRIYIVEDQQANNGAEVGGDIWAVADANGDGVAESIARWASLSTLGAEPTGLIFDPFNPDTAYVNVQHSASDNDATIKITSVPEPATGALLAIGTLGFLTRRRRRA